MSWLERPQQKSSNPATKFLQWKSEEKIFSYYDKSTGENIPVPLPFKFVILEHYHTVKGWNDATESGIYANEVLNIGSEPITVKAFKGKGNIADGLYKENKHNINAAGGHYARSIYAVTQDKEIINISLKGSAVSSYSDFINEHGDYNFDKYWIEVNNAEDRKKGKVKFSVPIFTKGSPITKREDLMPFANTLQEYMLEYTGDKKTVTDRENSEVDKYESNQEEDDLAF